MVDKETAPDGGAGMDLDAREEAARLRDEARQQRHAPAIQLVGHAVQQNGMEAGITEQHLHHALGGGVFPENSLDLFPDGSQHAAFLFR